MQNDFSLEFSRPISLRYTSDKIQAHTIEAKPDECAALAERFELIRIDRLISDFTLQAEEESDAFRLKGRIVADVIQACVLTLQDVPSHIEAKFDVVLLPHTHPIFQDDEDMLDTQDYEPYTDDTFDAGEVAAQYLALNLNSYPRHESIAHVGTAENSFEQTPRSPFSILAHLKS